MLLKSHKKGSSPVWDIDYFGSGFAWKIWPHFLHLNSDENKFITLDAVLVRGGLKGMIAVSTPVTTVLAANPTIAPADLSTLPLKVLSLL